MTCPIAPDHLTLLQLARAAIKAADDRTLWRHDTEAAAECHAAACELLWNELARQIDAQDGNIPVIDHPAVKTRKMVTRMRTEIINAVIATLEDLQSGPMLEDFDG